jgi:hypothetical protein
MLMVISEWYERVFAWMVCTGHGYAWKRFKLPALEGVEMSLEINAVVSLLVLLTVLSLHGVQILMAIKATI